MSRMVNETDAELRQRIIDIPIANKARAAIWRVFGMPNKDAENLRWRGVGSQLRIDIHDIQHGYAGKGDYVMNIPTEAITVLGKFEPEEK